MRDVCATCATCRGQYSSGLLWTGMPDYPTRAAQLELRRRIASSLYLFACARSMSSSADMLENSGGTVTVILSS